MTLTQNDLQQIRLIIIDEVPKIVRKEVKQQLDEQIGLLPKKDDFYKRMDKWMKAASTKDIEAPAHKSRHDRTDKRLDKIEKHLGITAY